MSTKQQKFEINYKQNIRIDRSWMSGGYQYNLTTQSQFQEMKQKYQGLLDQNYKLKKTIQQLININHQLTDNMEKFTNSDWAQSQRSKPAKQTNQETATSHQECQKFIQALEEQVQYFRGLAADKMENQENVEVVNALQGLIQSFKQVQKYYEDEINTLCEDIDNLKSEWQTKIFKIEQSYYQKTRVLEQVIRQIRKKQEMVAIIQKKLNQESKGTRKLLKKNSEIQTSSERKMSAIVQNRPIEYINLKQNVQTSNKQLEQLKQRQKKLSQQLKQKDKTIAIYGDLLVKLRKKLTQKF